MNNVTTNNQDNLFKPSSFYNLHGAGLGVWLVCLVLGSVFREFTSYQFRIIALILSFLIALAFLIKSKKWKKFEYLLLVIFNSALIFINASGYNTITYNIPFERKTFLNNDSNKIEVQKSGFFDFTNQKNWWPDRELTYENDSLRFYYLFANRKNETLEFQISYLKDWLQSAIKPEKRDEYNQVIKAIGLTNYLAPDINSLGSTQANRIKSLTNTVDSLSFQNELLKRTYTYDNKTFTADVLIDTLRMQVYKKSIKEIEQELEIQKLETKLIMAKGYLRITPAAFDSIINKDF